MSDQQYRVVADRDKGDDPRLTTPQDGDVMWWRALYGGAPRELVRIERPVPATHEPRKPELVTLHLYRDTCVGGLFLSGRELDRTLHEHVEALTIRRDRLPSPHPPTREQVAEALWHVGRDECDHRLWNRVKDMPDAEFTQQCWQGADAVLALFQNGADRD